MKRRQSFASLLLLAVVVAVVALLFATRPAPPEPARRPAGVLVETVPVTVEDTFLTVSAQGTARPMRRVELRAQVSGSIVEVSPSLTPGNSVDKGQMLVRIDPADFEAAVDQARAAVTQAQADLELERGRREVAEQEWRYFRERFESGSEAVNRDLALREPQLAAALGRLQQAEAQLQQARLNLARTTVTAPFDAIVQDESAALGQLAGPQSPIATLVSRAAVWVEAAVPVSRLGTISIPRVSGEEGSPVDVRWDTGGARVSYEGRVIELLPSLSTEGGMARVLIEVPQPTGRPGRAAQAAGKLPLLHGAYVDVEIRGTEPRRLTRVPREAIRNGVEVFLFDDGVLRIVEPEIVWRNEDAAFVASGLAPDARVIVTPLAAPADGMPLRLGPNRAEAAAAGATPAASPR